MPRNKETTDRQKKFLLAFRDPTGPAPDDWPAPSVLRRWLRHRGFRAALESIQQTLRRQADFHLTAAATRAAASFATNPDTPRTPKDLAELLRLSHVRQRFEVTAPPSTTDDPDPEEHDRPKSRKITKQDVKDNLKLLWCGDRITDEEFRALASYKEWIPAIRHSPEYPAPEPQDTFYYKLVAQPSRLLHWMEAYTNATSDKRYKQILERCHDIRAPHREPKMPPNAKLPPVSDSAPSNEPL